MSDFIIFSDANLQTCAGNLNLKNDIRARLYYIKILKHPSRLRIIFNGV